MGQITKNQHYISECLLENFSLSGKVYECLLKKKTCYSTNISNAMMESYVYEHPKLETNLVEKWFQKIEDYMGPAIREIILLINNCEGSQGVSLVRERICHYLSSILVFYYRSGALLYEYSKGGINDYDKILLMSQKIMNSRYIRQLRDTIVSHYDFTILKSENDGFIMSDQYVSTAALSIKNRFFRISNRHIGLRDTIILIPISSKYYVAWFTGNAPSYFTNNTIVTLSELETNQINSVIAQNSYVKCIARTRESLEHAIKDHLHENPTEILAGFQNGEKTGAIHKKEVFFYKRDAKAWEILTRWPLSHRYARTGRNDKCPCGSEKKYKICCCEPVKIAEKIIEPFKKNQLYPFAEVNPTRDTVSPLAVIEQPVFGY